MEISNLVSGMVGALVAVLFTELIKLWQHHLKVLRDRKTLINYISEVISPGIQRYILDLNQAKDEIRHYPVKNTAIQEHVYDSLPSLNSEILKGLDFKDLVYLVKGIKNHTLIIDMYHCIDYLKQQMGFDYVESYQNYARGHFERKGIETISQQLEHVKSCAGMNQAKETMSRRIDAKRSTALQVQAIISKLLDQL